MSGLIASASPNLSLTHILQIEKILPVERAIDLLAALLYARLNSVEIHGQITPDRVLIIAEQPTKIEILPPDRIGIDPEFSAPEIIDRTDRCDSSDVYSIGLITVYLITGIRPFQLFDSIERRWIWQDYLQQLYPIAGLNQSKFLALLDRSISIDPTARFSSIEQTLKALQDCYSSLAPPPPHWYCCQILVAEKRLTGSVNAIAISPHAPIVATGGEDKQIRLWNLETGRQLLVLTGHQKSISTLAVHPQLPHRLYSSGKDGQIKLWQLDSAVELVSINSNQHKVNALVISADGRYLITAGSDRAIKVWDAHTHTELMSSRHHQLTVNGLAVNPIVHPVQFASVSSDRRVMLWSIARDSPLAILTAHTQPVRTIAFSPDGKFLATGGDDGAIQIWDLDRRQLVDTLSGHHWTVSTLKFLPNTNILISGSWDGSLKFWRLHSWQEIDRLTVYESEVLALAVSFNGRYLVTSGRNLHPKIWRSI